MGETTPQLSPRQRAWRSDHSPETYLIGKASTGSSQDRKPGNPVARRHLPLPGSRKMSLSMASPVVGFGRAVNRTVLVGGVLSSGPASPPWTNGRSRSPGKFLTCPAPWWCCLLRPISILYVYFVPREYEKNVFLCSVYPCDNVRKWNHTSGCIKASTMAV